MSKPLIRYPVLAGLAGMAMVFGTVAPGSAQQAQSVAPTSSSLLCQPHQDCFPRDAKSSLTRAVGPERPAIVQGSELSRRYVEQRAEEGALPKVSKEIYFAFNSAEIGPEAKATLDAFGKDLLALPADQRKGHFNLIGHTDAKGGNGFNLKLSERRAMAAADYLASNNFIERDQLEAYGRGKEKLKDTTNPFGSANRRVEIINVGEKVAAAVVKETKKSSPTAKPTCTKYIPSIGKNITVDCGS